MALTSVRTLEADVVEIASGARSLLASAETAVRARSDRRALSYVRSTATGLRADIRSARTGLDTTDFTTLLRYERGEDVIAVWRWERDLRAALVDVDATMRRTQAVAEYLLSSTPDNTYIVKSGDTLQGIAARLLGDWKEWRRLAEVNGLDAGTLASGTVLKIPPRR